MKRNTNYLNKRILEFTEELNKDLNINEMELGEKSLKAPGLKGKWIQIYYEELDFQEKLEEAKEKLKEKFYEKYGESDDNPKFIIDRKLNETIEIKKLNKAIKEQEKVVRFLNDVNKNAWGGFSFDVKNAIDVVKLESM